MTLSVVSLYQLKSLTNEVNPWKPGQNWKKAEIPGQLAGMETLVTFMTTMSMQYIAYIGKAHN